MNMNTNQILTMTEANRNFSKAVKIADREGSAIIFKNNKPKYIVVNIDKNSILELSENEKIDVVAKRVMEKYKDAFMELAK